MAVKIAYIGAVHIVDGIPEYCFVYADSGQ